ncbi:protein of unknown function [Pseudomonas mediterranea]
MPQQHTPDQPRLKSSPRPGTELIPVARGFIPAGLRSGPKTCLRGANWMGLYLLGPLRGPAGINPLATDFAFRPCHPGSKAICG